MIAKRRFSWRAGADLTSVIYLTRNLKPIGYRVRQFKRSTPTSNVESPNNGNASGVGSFSVGSYATVSDLAAVGTFPSLVARYARVANGIAETTGAYG